MRAPRTKPATERTRTTPPPPHCQVPRAIEAGRVWVNCYHAYPAHAPFGGYKQSGFGRETHKMMLNHYRQTKNMLISLDKNKLGFF